MNVKGSSGDASGSGLGSGPTLDLAQEGKKTTGTWVTDSRISIISTPASPKDSINCLPRGSDWPYCVSHGEVTFSVPNFFNHTQAEDVVAVLNEWDWLLRSGCHHGLEWFFCLLLAPRCHQPSEKSGIVLLPCRTFCEVLLDSCWTVLQERGLPVACHTLPEGPEPSQPCITVSNHKGKTKMHLKLVPLVLSVCVIHWCAFYRERHRSLPVCQRLLCSATALPGFRPALMDRVTSSREFASAVTWGLRLHAWLSVNPLKLHACMNTNYIRFYILYIAFSAV